MLGPFLPKTELLFDVIMGHQRAFNYRFTEKIYQFAIGCYNISADKPFFCRVNRSKHTGRHIRMFLLPVCKSSKYTCIELTHQRPCAFCTTPSWVIVMTDTSVHEYTGRLDPYNGGTVWVESQGLVDSSRLSLDETLSWFSSFTYVAPSALAQEMPDIVDDFYSPSNRILLRVANEIKNQTIVPSVNVIKLLLSLVPETNAPSEEVPSSLRQRLTDVQSSLHYSDKMDQRRKNQRVIPPPRFSSHDLDTIVEGDEGRGESVDEDTVGSSIGGGSIGGSSIDEPATIEEEDDVPYQRQVSVTRGTEVPTPKSMIQAWIRAAKALAVADSSKYTFQNLMLLSYKFWSDVARLPSIDTMNPESLLHNLAAELNPQLKSSMPQHLAFNNLVMKLLKDACVLAESKMMELLVELASETIDISRVGPTNLQPFVDAKAATSLAPRFAAIAHAVLKPSHTVMDELDSMAAADAAVAGL